MSEANSKLSDNINIIVSIIIGLTITKILEKVSEIIKVGDIEKLSGYQAGWLIILLVAQIQYWWSIIRHEVTGLNLWKFLIIILSPITMYIMYSIIIPSPLIDTDASENYYYGNKTLFFGLGIAVLIANFADEVIRRGDWDDRLKLLLQGILFVIFVLAILLPYHCYHIVIIPSTFLLIFFINANREGLKLPGSKDSSLVDNKTATPGSV